MPNKKTLGELHQVYFLLLEHLFKKHQFAKVFLNIPCNKWSGNGSKTRIFYSILKYFIVKRAVAWYIINIRDITDSDSGPLLYSSQYISQNSSYFVIPLNKLGKGRTYRWSLCSVDSSGKKNIFTTKNL